MNSIDNLKKLLALPKALKVEDKPYKVCSIKRDCAWKELTKDEALFQALKEAVKKGDIGDAASYVEEWGEYEQGNSLYDIVRALVWCAERAVEPSNSFRNEIDSTLLRLFNVKLGEDIRNEL